MSSAAVARSRSVSIAKSNVGNVGYCFVDKVVVRPSVVSRHL